VRKTSSISLIVVATLAAALVVAPLYAQDPPAAAPMAGKAVVEEQELATRYLPDENGKLVPVPGITYERFRELLLLESRVGGAEPPTVVIDRLEITGDVQGELAQLNVEATVHLRKAGWTLVPFRFNDSVLRGAISTDAATKFIHRHDPRDGHQVWLQAPADTRAQVKLPLAARVVPSGGERQLSMPLPKASVSDFSLRVEGEVSDAVLRSGEGLVTVEPAGETFTSLAVHGVAGDVSLAWRRLDAAAQKTSGLEVTADISARIETRDVARLEANFRVMQLLDDAERLLVRLPRYTQWIPQTTRGYSVTPASAADLAALGSVESRPESGPVVVIDFERDVESPQFSLAATFSPPEGTDEAIELGGFEVLGGRRQTGFVSVSIPPGWSLNATTSADVFRTDDAAILPGQLRPDARYRFIRQPFSLKIEALPQPPRTVVEPAYAAVVEANRTTLTGTLNYQVRGPRPEFLEVELGEWSIDQVGPADLVSLETVEKGQAAKLRLQPGTLTEFTVQLELHRNTPAEAVQLEFELPRPVATQVLPARLTVTTADNIALSPDTDAMRAMVAEDRDTTSAVLVDGPRPLVFRELLSDAEKPRFTAAFEVRKRRVTATLSGRAQLGEQQAQMEQRLALDIAYEPLRTLALDAPREGFLSEPQVFLGDQLLVVRTDAAKEGADRLQWQVELPGATTGSVELLIRYALTLPARERIELPLVAPTESAELSVARQTIEVSSRTAEKYLLAEELQRDPSISLTATPEGMHWECSRRLPLLALQPPPVQSTGNSLHRLDRVWFQTWLTSTGRRDHYAAQVASSVDRLIVQLPHDLEPEDIRVLIDGVAPRKVQKQGATLALDLEPSARNRRTLELWYLLPQRMPSLVPAAVALQMPSIEAASTPLQTFIQIVTPPNQQVLFASANVVPQQTWRKTGWGWQRGGRLSTEELQEWSGASSADLSPAQSHDALFMTLGSAESVHVYVWGRRWLWLLAALGVLLVGSVLIKLGRTRAWQVMVSICLLSMLGALLAPELAFTLGPFIGVGLLLLAAVAWSAQFAGNFHTPEGERKGDHSTVSRVASRTPSAREVPSTATTSLPKPTAGSRIKVAGETPQ
jgi:hypothetical protein